MTPPSVTLTPSRVATAKPSVLESLTNDIPGTPQGVGVKEPRFTPNNPAESADYLGDVAARRDAARATEAARAGGMQSAARAYKQGGAAASGTEVQAAWTRYMNKRATPADLELLSGLGIKVE